MAVFLRNALCLAPKARPHCSPGQRPGAPLPQRMRAESPRQALFQKPCFGLSALSRILPEVLARWARLQCGRAFGPECLERWPSPKSLDRSRSEALGLLGNHAHLGYQNTSTDDDNSRKGLTASRQRLGLRQSPASFVWDATNRVPVSNVAVEAPETLGNLSGCESGRGLFLLPTSLCSACSSRNRRSKACHPERSLRSEGPHNTAQNVPLSMALSKQTTFLFWAVQWTPAPSFAASVWVVLVRLREILRFEDCAQDDKIGAPFWLPSPVTKLVGNGKRGLQHSKTLARLRLRLRLRRCAREFAHFRRSDRSTGKRVSEENHERS